MTFWPQITFLTVQSTTIMATVPFFTSSACGVPPHVNDASILSFNGQPFYQCRDGFQMSGNPAPVCDSISRIFSGLPSCTPIQQTTEIFTYVNNLGIPEWLQILIGVLGALLLLLGLILLIACCCCRDAFPGLNWCWNGFRGSRTAGRGKVIYPDHTVSGRREDADVNDRVRRQFVRQDGKERVVHRERDTVYFIHGEGSPHRILPHKGRLKRPLQAAGEESRGPLRDEDDLGDSGIDTHGPAPKKKLHAERVEGDSHSDVSAGRETPPGGRTVYAVAQYLPSSTPAPPQFLGNRGLREDQVRFVQRLRAPPMESGLWMPHKNPIRPINTSTK